MHYSLNSATVSHTHNACIMLKLSTYFSHWHRATLLLVLLYCMALSQVFSQISVLSRTPAQGCAGTCDGAIRIKPIDDAAVPFDVMIKDANGNIQQVNNLSGVHEFTGLCAGACEITVVATKLQGCVTKLIRDYVPSTGGNIGGFQVEVVKKENESTRDFNDGSLSVKAIPNGTYSYLWSNGMIGASISGITSGSYTVTATNAVGCVVSRTFELEACYDWVSDIDPFTEQPTSRLDYVGKYFELDIKGGVLSPLSSIDTLSALVKAAGSNTFVLATQSYQVKWFSGDGDSLGIGPVLYIKKEDASRLSPISVSVSNGCEVKGKSRTLILCGANNTTEVLDYFVDQVQARCVYGNRVINGGLISLAFPLTSTDPNLPLSILQNGSTSVPYTTDGGRSRATAWITQLNSGTHTFQVSMGTCVNSFSVNVAQKSATLSFREYKDSCKYQLLCEGSPTGVYVNFSAVNAQNWQPSGTNECTSPIFCDYDNVYREVGKAISDDEYIERSKAGIYVALMESELRNPNTRFERNWIWNQIFRFERMQPCINVKFCKNTLAVIDVGSPYINLRGDSARLSCSNGQIRLECGFSSEDRKKINYNPDFPPNNCCGQQIQLPLKYLLESFKTYKVQIYQSKINTEFAGSQLEQLLISLEQNPDNRVNCASVTFCLPDYNVIKNTIENVKPCADTRVLLIDSTYLNNGNGTFGNHTNCEDLGDVSNALRNYYACLYTFDLSEFGHTFRVPPAEESAIPLIATNTAENGSYESFYRLLAFGETPNEYLGQEYKIYEDSINHDELRNFLTISSEGRLCPKGLIRTQDEFGYYNYSDFRRNVDIQDFNNVHLAYEDWDTNRSFYIGTHVPGKDLYLQFKDSTQTWTAALSADTSIHIQHLSVHNQTIQVGGQFSGTLTIKGQQILEQDSTNTAFLASFDVEGNLLKVRTIENIDTSAGLAFSENRTGEIILAGKSQQNWIKIDGRTVTFSALKTGFIAKANDLDSLVLLNKIDQLGAGKIRDISYAEGKTQFGILLENVGSITPAGSIPVVSIGNQVAVLFFSNNGNFVTSRHYAAQGLHLDQTDLTYGTNDGLIWGFTYSGTLNWGSQLFSSNGNEDVGLVKFDVNGNVEWHKSYGSGDKETVSHLLYENGVLYFGGQLNGNTQVRRMGSYYFINPTSFKNRTYISYVLDTVSTTASELYQATSTDLYKREVFRAPIDTKLRVYPNPFKEEVVLEFQSERTMNVVIDIRNELGRQVKTMRQNTVVGFNQHSISTNDLPTGFYYLSLYNREGKLIGVQKLIKID